MSNMEPKAMSLTQVLGAAERASGQVASWPKWKRELSAPLMAPEGYAEAHPWWSGLRLRAAEARMHAALAVRDAEWLAEHRVELDAVDSAHMHPWRSALRQRDAAWAAVWAFLHWMREPVRGRLRREATDG